MSEKLVDSAERVDPSECRQAKATFAFLNRVAGPYWDAVRDVTERWYADYIRDATPEQAAHDGDPVGLARRNSELRNRPPAHPRDLLKLNELAAPAEPVDLPAALLRRPRSQVCSRGARQSPLERILLSGGT